MVFVEDLFKDLGIEDPTLAANIPKYFKVGSERLYELQHEDGGWGWWENDETHPYMTAYVTYGLIKAQQAGLEVQQDAIDRGIGSIKEQLKKEKDRTTQLFMLQTLSLVNQGDPKLLRKIYEDRKGLNPYAKAILALLLSQSGDPDKLQTVLQEIREAKIVEDSLVHWEGQEFHYNWQDDSLETTAYALRALVAGKSENGSQDGELIGKASRWALTQRIGDSWRSTKSTAIMVHAFYDVVKKTGELAPDYSVSVYLNGELVESFKMTKEDLTRGRTITILDSQLKKGENIIKLEKSGRGVLYYSAALKYYTGEENLQASDHGFTVSREYYRLKKVKREDAYVYLPEKVEGPVKSGEELLVRVTVKNPGNFEYFLLEDPIPAGAEVIKEDKGYEIEGDPNYTGENTFEYRYAGKEIHDNRVALSLTYLEQNEFVFSYLLRAQIPGEYHVMPAMGSLMYFPEKRGHSDELLLKIED